VGFNSGFKGLKEEVLDGPLSRIVIRRCYGPFTKQTKCMNMNCNRYLSSYDIMWERSLSGNLKGMGKVSSGVVYKVGQKYE